MMPKPEKPALPLGWAIVAALLVGLIGAWGVPSGRSSANTGSCGSSLPVGGTPSEVRAEVITDLNTGAPLSAPMYVPFGSCTNTPMTSFGSSAGTIPMKLEV